MNPGSLFWRTTSILQTAKDKCEDPDSVPQLSTCDLVIWEHFFAGNTLRFFGGDTP